LYLLAAGLLKGIPRFENVARIIELQLRNYNGLGEPLDDFTKGDDIPFGARFLHIVIDLVKTSSRSLSGTEALNQCCFIRKVRCKNNFADTWFHYC
jgi:hypothetical protein